MQNIKLFLKFQFKPNRHKIEKASVGHGNETLSFCLNTSGSLRLAHSTDSFVIDEKTLHQLTSKYAIQTSISYEYS